jgi:hypothetical protein
LKSGSASEPPRKFRLSRTLKRRLEFRPLETEDLRYLWAAYKKGCLKDMAAPFDGTEMTVDEFKAEFLAAVTTRYHGAWTLFGETGKGFIPVGCILGFYSHPLPDWSPFMIVGDMVWMPWATTRNKIESAVHFFAHIRKEIAMVDYAYGETNKRFFEVIARHGVMRRVGTMLNVVKNEPVAVFETRAL